MISRLVLCGAIFVLTNAQPPEGSPPNEGPPDQNSDSSSGACDICGTMTTYMESIEVDNEYILDFIRTIRGNGCPNHYSVCTGKEGVPGCSAIGAEGTDTEANEQNFEYTIPARPVLREGDPTDLEYEMDSLGIALNGVSFYGGAVAPNELLDVTDETSEWTAFDMCSGHSQLTGNYHYHFPPSCLIKQAEARNPSYGAAEGHSPQIGWAYDGFPVYGPLYIDGVSVTSDMTDSCGGIQEEIPDLDNFKYRYYMTGDTSDLYSLPSNPKPAESDYPFLFTCRVGCTYEELKNGTCSGTPGYVDGSDETIANSAVRGYTDAFEEYGSDSSIGYFGDTYESAFIGSDGKCVNDGSAVHETTTD